MRLKALVEIYTMHSFAQLQNHIFFKKLVEVVKICENFQKFCEIDLQMLEEKKQQKIQQFNLTKLLRLESGAKECFV